MKKTRAIIFLALLTTIFSSCGFIFGDKEYYDAHFKSEKRNEEKAQTLINNINNRDAAGIKEMFSSHVRSNCSELDNQINELLSLFPNGINEYEIDLLTGGQMSTSNWNVSYADERAHICIPKKEESSGQEEKSITINYIFIDKDNPDREGVTKIYYKDNRNPFELSIGL